MKRTLALALAIAIFSEGWLAAATKPTSVRYKIPVIDGADKTWLSKNESVYFSIEIIGDQEGVKSEHTRDRAPFVKAINGENYSIRLHNPLPVRVAVNLTVDGLNSISGKPDSITGGQKWMIDPYSYITIRGWQVNQGESRRFFFTDKPKSYAAWRGEKLDLDLSANCGVIGAAFFWSSKELNRYYENHPIYVRSRNEENQPFASKPSDIRFQDGYGGDKTKKSLERGAAASVDELKAGTGMGTRESHPTTQVEFNYDRGMYSPKDALLVYYDFLKPQVPSAFPGLSYAPEMN